MVAYYNEIDPYAAQWLRNLVSAGHIAAGDVDERDIRDVDPRELLRYTQCHFFAGIGGWSYALRLAGWSDDRPVWTGSCPCQPFTISGERAGFADERHLWPAFHHLIDQCQPAVVLGEQVASQDGLVWLDLVWADLEASGYACAAADLGAASVGAPHIRQRLWWMADSESQRRGRGQGIPTRGQYARYATERNQSQHGSVCSSEAGSFWSMCDHVRSIDRKLRPTQPGVLPLAHGISRKMERLRASGNAIVPQVAEQFIRSVMDVTNAEI